MVRSNLRMSSEAELVGADYVHHGGSAFELTKAQIKMHNEMRNAQDRLARRGKVKAERKASLKANGSRVAAGESKAEEAKGMQTGGAFTVSLKKNIYIYIQPVPPHLDYLTISPSHHLTISPSHHPPSHHLTISPSTILPPHHLTISHHPSSH